MQDGEVIEAPADQTLFTKRYTEETIRFIRENKDEPFFVYLAHNMPHIPLHASEAFVGKSMRGLYGDVIEELDWSVGRILDALQEEGLDKKTFVVLTSDNGPKKEAGGSSLDLKGAKGSSFEGGVRVPCLMRWPGKIPAGGETDEPAAIMDLLPTLLELAGGEVPTEPVIDGKDIWPLVSGGAGAQSPHEAYYYFKGASPKGIRVGDWKFIIEESPKEEKQSVPIELTKEERKLPRDERRALIKRKRAELGLRKGSIPALYDLNTDRSEQQNRVGDKPEFAGKLKEKMEAFHSDLNTKSRPIGISE